MNYFEKAVSTAYGNGLFFILRRTDIKICNLYEGLGTQEQKSFAFDSYGWKPCVVNQIQQVFEDLKWKTINPFEENIHQKMIL